MPIGQSLSHEFVRESSDALTAFEKVQMFERLLESQVWGEDVNESEAWRQFNRQLVDCDTLWVARNPFDREITAVRWEPSLNH